MKITLKNKTITINENIHREQHKLILSNSVVSEDILYLINEEIRKLFNLPILADQLIYSILSSSPEAREHLFRRKRIFLLPKEEDYFFETGEQILEDNEDENVSLIEYEKIDSNQMIQENLIPVEEVSVRMANFNEEVEIESNEITNELRGPTTASSSKSNRKKKSKKKTTKSIPITSYSSIFGSSDYDETDFDYEGEEIGRWGEKYAFKCLKQDLKDNYPDAIIEEDENFELKLKLSDNTVIEAKWLNNTSYASGSDIELTNNNEKVYIEIKSTKSSRPKSLKISRPQWHLMRTKGDSYFLYRVYNAGKDTAYLKKIQNPYKQIIEGKLDVKILNIIT